MPRYLVWQEDYEGSRDDAQKIDAFDHESAAEEYAEDNDSDQDFIFARTSGEGVPVLVAEDVPGSKSVVVLVRAEESVTYFATMEKEEPADG